MCCQHRDFIQNANQTMFLSMVWNLNLKINNLFHELFLSVSVVVNGSVVSHSDEKDTIQLWALKPRNISYEEKRRISATPYILRVGCLRRETCIYICFGFGTKFLKCKIHLNCRSSKHHKKPRFFLNLYIFGFGLLIIWIRIHFFIKWKIHLNCRSSTHAKKADL